MLIEKGSCPKMTDNNMKTPLDYAMNYNHKEIAYHLLSAGADDQNLKNYITEPRFTRGTC